MFSPTDTIVAIATAPARAGIGVVRISGPQALDVAHLILTVPGELAPRHATLTHAFARGHTGASSGDAVHVTGPGSSNPGSSVSGQLGPGVFRGQVEPGVFRGQMEPGVFPGLSEVEGRPRVADAIDEVVATYFPAPHSYTAEDVVEISAHGSVVLLREILHAAIGAGARLAEPGEFTLRAFLNGRLDLVQAEAVADLVDAVTPLQARVAFDQLEGTLTRAIGALDRELFELAARLEASVDFPEEGYHFVEPGEAAAWLRRVKDGIDALLETSGRGRVIREGRQIAILGKPNVGKSSLFNRLVGTDRAIVTSQPGTTRDMVTETIDLDGIRLGLVDTAGIRTSGDEVEREGVLRARRAAEVADLVVLVLDRSRPFDEMDRALLDETAGARRIVVINKADLVPAWTADASGPLRGRAAAAPILLSLKTGEGVAELRAAMRPALDVEEPLRDAPIVSNVRHEGLLRRARESVERAFANAEQTGEPASEDLVLADLQDARRAFEEITGRRTTEDLLGKIFEKFCVGK